MLGSSVFIGRDKYKKESPHKGANIFSKLIFWYAHEVFLKARKKRLTEAIITQPLEEHKAAILGNAMTSLWLAEVEQAEEDERSPNIFKVLRTLFFSKVLIYTIYMCIVELVLKMMHPLILKQILIYFSNHNYNSAVADSESPKYLQRLIYIHDREQSPIDRYELYFYSVIFLIIYVIILLTHEPFTMYTMHTGMQMRIGCTSLLYRKLLRLKQRSDLGKNIKNLISPGLFRFDFGVVILPYMIISPLQLIMISFYSFIEIGVFGLYGISLILANMPLQVCFSTLLLNFKRRLDLERNKTTVLLQELYKMSHIIKMYTWEYVFSEAMNRNTAIKMKYWRRLCYIKGLIITFVLMSSRCALYVTVATYVISGGTLNGATFFTLAYYYYLFQQTMTVSLPLALMNLSELNVAISALQKVLLLDEVAMRTIEGKEMPKMMYKSWDRELTRMSHFQELAIDVFIKLKRVSAAYGKQFCLQNINLEMRFGELIVVLGPEYSGKSSLLRLIIGEVEPKYGEIDINGTISYLCQEPWLFEGTVRENIIFGQRFNRYWYEEVLRVCNLKIELPLLPFGDRTYLGENATKVTRNQNAKINLARALYRKADIYLIENALLSLPKEEQILILENGIKTYLKEKLVLVVTSELQFLVHADRIVLLDQGRVIFFGSYEEFIKKDLRINTLINKPLATEYSDKHLKSEKNSLYSIVKKVFNENQKKIFVEDDVTAFQTRTEHYENKHARKIKHSNIWKYLNISKFLIIFLFIWTQIFASGVDCLFANWISYDEINRTTKDPQNKRFLKDKTRLIYLIVYTIMIVAGIITSLTRIVIFFQACLKSFIMYPTKIIDALPTADLSFLYRYFNKRIIGQLASDLQKSEEILPPALFESIQAMIHSSFAMLIIGTLNPFLLIPTCMMCLCLYSLYRSYVRITSDISNLEETCKYPILHHVQVTLGGLSIIRAHKSMNEFIQEYETHLDSHSSIWFTYLFTSRAFAYWSDCACGMYALIVFLSFIFSSTSYSDTEIGLVIMQVSIVMNRFAYGIKQHVKVHDTTISLEKIYSYSEIESEKNLRNVPGQKISLDWPRLGQIEYSSVTMIYNFSELMTLKNLNVVIPPGKRIGLVANSYLGTTSIVWTLFHLVPYEGRILIDNVNTKLVCLHDLRNRISIVPRRSLILPGTLRYNMDPRNEFSDADIENIFNEMKVFGLPSENLLLNRKLTTKGTDLTNIEKYLVNFARALLKKNKIIIVDESVMNAVAFCKEYENYIKKTRLSECTVIISGDKLNLIMETEKVIVLHNGCVAEYNHPHLLLQKEDGLFEAIVSSKGTNMSKHLRSIAERNFNKQYLN